MLLEAAPFAAAADAGRPDLAACFNCLVRPCARAALASECVRGQLYLVQAVDGGDSATEIHKRTSPTRHTQHGRYRFRPVIETQAPLLKRREERAGPLAETLRPASFCPECSTAAYCGSACAAADRGAHAGECATVRARGRLPRARVMLVRAPPSPFCPCSALALLLLFTTPLLSFRSTLR